MINSKIKWCIKYVILRNVSIEPVEKDDDSPPQQESTCGKRAGKDVRQAEGPATKRPTKKGVNFHDKDLQPPHSTNIAAVDPESKLECLRKALWDASEDQGRLGFIDDLPWQHYIYIQTHNEISSETLTFSDMTTRGLGTAEKYRILSTLSSAVLQLCNTPWLNQDYGLDDVRFYNNGRDGPYARKHFMRNPGPSLGRKPSVILSSRNQWIFNSGVALVKLAYEKSILEL
ncbi:MAG: hypothetical protein MMC23_000261 [Stictis urceolatum]|nr:hypothetical protein [Stictis urceolata]